MGSRSIRGKSAPKPRGKRLGIRRAKKAAPRKVSKVSSRNVDALARELVEAREQQAAAGEVLRVIANSTGDLGPVFRTILKNAVRLCEAKYGTLFRYEGGMLHVAAQHGTPRALVEFQNRRGPFQTEPGTLHARAVKTKRVAHTADYAAEASPGIAAKIGGARSTVVVPMLKDGRLIGTIVIYRQEVRPFTDKQIELVKSFAAQAVIAIENARLLSELRQRTDDLSEALEQQTATSEVLKAISGSRGELEPVFKTALENATRICEANFGFLWLAEGDAFRAVALHGVPPALVRERREVPTLVPDPEVPLGRLRRTRETIYVRDLTEEQRYRDGEPSIVELVDLGGARTLLLVPMLREQQLVGAISIYRQEMVPFTQRQIELVQNFAAQAVIAIENARLLSELRESLQQQTATADVLKVISRSTFDLQTVLNTLVQSAARLCEADSVAIRRPEGAAFVHAAHHGMSVEMQDHMRNRPIEPGANTIAGRVLLARGPVHVADVQADPDYALVGAVRNAGFRAHLGVPLLREGSPIGVMILARKTARPFTEKQIELVTTFADQAVIAIENVRLFEEIQQKSRELEEASRHKSQFLANMSHELRTPLNAIIGYTELIIDSVYGETPEKVQAVLKRIESNGRHLLGLINDVLDFSKIEAGQLKLELADYSMRDIVHNVFSAVEPLAAKKNLKFSVALPADMPTGRGDERKLTQVLLNLVGNAIKFTDAGEVTIKVAPRDGLFSVSVHDTGPGIPEADHERLFQEFQQADNSITKAKAGTGLGLAISRRIVEMHGGRLWVESAPGKGSIFTFEIPSSADSEVPS